MRSHAKAATSGSSTRQGTRLGALTIVAAFALAFMAFLGIGAPAAMADNLPTVSAESASEVGVTSVKLTGKVNPNGEAGTGNTTWRLQYSPAGDEAWVNANEGTIEAPAGEEANDVDVEAIFGFGGELQPGAEYEFRLQAENGAGLAETASPYPTFTMDAATAPTVVTVPATAVTIAKAHVAAEVDPEGGNVNPIGGPLPIGWTFEYTKASEPSDWQFGNGGSIQSTEAEGSTAVEIGSDLKGLSSGTEYLYRVSLSYANNLLKTSGNASFTTLASTGPSVLTGSATHIHPTHAYLTGSVNPNEEPTLYWFEYGSGPCDSSTCTAVPAAKDANAGEGTEALLRSKAIGGLEPSTTYHFRLVAGNASGSAQGLDQTFTTSAAPAEGACPNKARRAEQPLSFVLPDCRAWELASAGGSIDISSDTGRTVAAAGESPGLPMAVKFSAPPFGDAAGAGSLTDFLAQRDAVPGTAGWSVHGITPPQEARSFAASLLGLDPVYELFNPDLTSGIFRSYSSLPGTSANAAPSANLYLREDVRQPGVGGYSLVTDSENPLPSPSVASRRPWIAGASADFAHVVFETKENLTANATGSNVKLYKSDHGVVRLIKASSACAGSFFSGPCARAGIGAVGIPAAHFTPHVISSNGSRVIFTSPMIEANPTSRPGVVSKLYQLDDGGTTSKADDVVIQLNASESPSPEAARVAEYQDASSDGSRTFFTSAEQLTSAPGGGLYMWGRHTDDETQSLTVDATGGEFTLTAHAQPTVGQGTLTAGSTEVTEVTGSFTVGQTISAPGIPAGTTVTEVGSFSEETILLSAPATEDGTQPLAASFSATTAPLAWNATAPQVASALEALSLIGAGNVSVTGGPGGSAPFEVEFTGGLAGVDVMPLTADPGGLNGGASTATVTTTNDVHNLTLIATGGSELLGAAEDGTRVYYSQHGGIRLWTDDGTASGGTSFVASGWGVPLNVRGLDMYWNFAKQPTSRVSPDGRFLLFQANSGADLPPGYVHGPCGDNQNGSCAEFYLYRADTSAPVDPDIVCASCNLAKPGASGETFLNARYGVGSALTANHLSRALSDDGRRVFFDTDEALVPDDTNGKVDVYEYDVPSGEDQLISSGTDSSDSYLMDASADGSDVFFTTREQLAGWDDDLAYDLYDARAGGGFPEPPPPPPVCSGDACRPAPGATPSAPPVGSGQSGPGNKPKVQKTCPKGTRAVRRHGKTRCVRKHHHRRTANSNRRAGK